MQNSNENNKKQTPERDNKESLNNIEPGKQVSGSKGNWNKELNKSDRNGYQQCKVGKCGETGDDGGHLIATRFSGLGEKINMVPMNSNLNRSEWKKMENIWARSLKDNKEISVKIESVYIRNSDRPNSINVTYKIGNEPPIERTFINDSKGEK